jgi:hypothetical protein
MVRYLVPGRSCGECTVCCVELTIEDPKLHKAAGVRCGNLTSAHTCAIYEERPQTCQLFFCGWRQLRWIDDQMRPDESGVLILVHTASHGLQAGVCLGVGFLILDQSSLDSQRVARAVAATVAAGVPVALHTPGPPGKPASQVRVDEVLRGAVWARDNAAILAILKQAHAQGLIQAGTEASDTACEKHADRNETGHLGPGSDVC